MPNFHATFKNKFLTSITLFRHQNDSKMSEKEQLIKVFCTHNEIWYGDGDTTQEGAAHFVITLKLKLLITDVENPTITCPQNRVHELVDHSNTITLYWGPPVITDNSGDWRVIVNDTRHRSGHPLTEGDYVIQYVAVDHAGNQNECTFSIHLDSKFD